MTEELRLLQAAIAAQQRLNEAILSQIEELNRERSERQWVPLEDGAAALGKAFSAAKIRDDIKAGFLKYGQDYIDTSNGSRPCYAVKVAALRKVYGTPPEQRKPA